MSGLWPTCTFAEVIFQNFLEQSLVFSQDPEMVSPYIALVTIDNCLVGLCGMLDIIR